MAKLSPSVEFDAPEFIDVNGVSVAYRRRGDGTPILYLHGSGMTRRWLPLYSKLAEAFDVIVPEHPGFGDTERPEHIDGWTDLVLHYADLLDAFDLGTAHVVGYDLGGWLAAELAAVFPERVRSLTLIAPMGMRVPGVPVPDRFRLDDEQLAAALFNDHAADYAPYYEDPDADETFFRNYAESTMTALLSWTPRYDIKLDTRLRRFRGPALVVAAGEDRLVSSDHTSKYADVLPNASLVTLKGASHGVIGEQPDDVASCVVQHVRGALG